MTNVDTKAVMEKFKQFCLQEQSAKTSQKIDPAQDQDWFSLSLGFFAAFGITGLKAHKMACKARYTHHYWDLT